MKNNNHKYKIADELRKTSNIYLEVYKDTESKLPFLEIPENIIIKPIPPFGGKVFRCHFALKSNPEISLSVYLDGYIEMEKDYRPYWEIHSNKDNDCSRFLIHETKEMMSEVAETLEFLNKTK